MSEIQQNRYDQLLRRVADLKGPGSKVNDALTELFPMIDVENVPGELLALSQMSLAFAGVQRASIAAEFPRVMLFNPAGSGKLVVVSSVMVVNNSSVQTIRYTVTPNTIGVDLGIALFRDTRLGLLSRPTAQIQTASTVVQTGATSQFNLGQNVPIVLEDENSLFVLEPGTGLEFGGDQAQSVIQVNYRWRERVAEPSELNF